MIRTVCLFKTSVDHKFASCIRSFSILLSTSHLIMPRFCLVYLCCKLFRVEPFSDHEFVQGLLLPDKPKLANPTAC